MANPLTYNQTVRGMTEFLEVAIHQILYVRQVYPAELFIRRKKYDTPVFQSRHPALNEYISGAVKAVGEELALGRVDKIVIVLKNKEQVPLERYIFAVENMIEIEPFNKDTGIEEAMSAEALGQYFRAFLIKLSMMESQLGQLKSDDDPSFGIIIELKNNAKPLAPQDSEGPPPWIPADTQHTTPGTPDSAELYMIRALNTGIINLSLAVQESPVKLRDEGANKKKTTPKTKAKDPENSV